MSGKPAKVPRRTRHENAAPKRRGDHLACLRRGRAFEAEEKSGWRAGPHEILRFERVIRDPRNRLGRMDIFVQADPDMVAIAEVKATAWDRILARRVRVLALRHCQQLWRYIDAHLGQGLSVCAGLVYPRPPKSRRRRAEVERLLAERFTQCVWRREGTVTRRRVSDPAVPAKS